ncbi:MAG: [protein-PII] uridylyltransferase [Alphaproteobacteria bacterium]|nr:[protein-PII] uridylyltransferase [Alphaproteobacteria bacterium]
MTEVATEKNPYKLSKRVNYRTSSRKMAKIFTAAIFGDFVEVIQQNGGDYPNNAAETRLALLNKARLSLKDVRHQAFLELTRTGKGTQCARGLSAYQDGLISALMQLAETHVFADANANHAQRIAVVAVGGYGRDSLAPHSDIDLLMLLPAKPDERSEQIIEFILYFLWDLNFKVGHAVRNVEQSITHSKTDMTIRTSILEARFICGNQGLFKELGVEYDQKIVKGHGREFTEAKLEERDLRHQASGKSRYLVEPNIKDGKGGLRDLHTLFWIGKYIYQLKRASQMVEAGVFTEVEYRNFRKCEDFLWSVRCHLHFLVGRAEERVSFDVQEELAERLGYSSHGGLRAVERFMKHYFIMAKRVGDLTRIFCAVLESQEIKQGNVAQRLLSRFIAGKNIEEINKTKAFKVEHGRIVALNDQIFIKDPTNLIGLFYLIDKYSLLIHPVTLKLVTRSLRLIDDDLRANLKASILFLKLLCSKNAPEINLRKMNEAGVLGRYIKPFGKIVSLMQFNMYHHYTVDEHLLRAVGVLSRIDAGLEGEAHPTATEIIGEITNRRALYMAVFIHDIAKGRKESHSVAGAREAKLLCPTLGMSKAETELVEWLVLDHLEMSEVAQTRDLMDPKTIEDFAAKVKTLERLRMLLVLTVVDIRAVGPGVWNGWKGQLLRDLYYQTEMFLTGGNSAEKIEERVKVAKALLTDELKKLPIKKLSQKQQKHFVERHYPTYLIYVPVEMQVKHALLIKKADKDGLATSVSTDAFLEMTKITVIAADHSRLLSIVTGSCAAMGGDIVGAHIFTTRDGMAVDRVQIKRQFENDLDEKRRGKSITNTIEKALRGEIHLPSTLEEKPLKQNIDAFHVEPKVSLSNQLSEKFTVIEIRGLDRPKLLYDLTCALYQLNLNIGSAHISTVGEQAIDAFYVIDLMQNKITSEERQDNIKATLLAILQN